MTEMETKIKRVTVFRDGARVTRVGKRTLEAGPQKVLIMGITEYAHEDSFRVKGRGPASLSSIDVKRHTEVYEPVGDIQALRDQLERLQDQYQQLKDDHELHTARLSQLEAMNNEFAGTFGMVFAANEGDITALTEMDKTSGKMIAETRSKLRDIEREMRELEDQMNVVRQNLGRDEYQRRTKVSYNVEVNLEVSQRAEVELEVSYQCDEAGWIPTYDVDLLPTKAKIRRVAMVTNQTMEPWERVGLVVSSATAQPVEAVEPTPLIIDVYSPPPPRPSRSMTGGGMPPSMPGETMPIAAPSLKVEAARPPPAPPMLEEFAEVSEAASGVSVYELPKPVTIPCDDDRHPVTLVEEELATKTIHYWYADGMSEVVAQDLVTNNDSVILPGKVKVYAEGDYIGESLMPLVSPREEFKMGTRLAYDVKAKKKMVSREVEKTGITRGKLRRSYTYRLELENFSKRPIEIEVFDRVPHSLNPAIEVKVDWERLGLEKYELGVMQWKKTIDIGKKETIEYSYEVFWEKGVTVSPPLV
ncbi:MAG: mucoidy inhibitor MuiA family protein [Candidatus Thorarchaeota archaeon]|nr:mucoidy inhibitor MuiA family protein [Candidatus Thorarchaeota archaeon]